jgi:hypothetical protein
VVEVHEVADPVLQLAQPITTNSTTFNTLKHNRTRKDAPVVGVHEVTDPVLQLVQPHTKSVTFHTMLTKPQ